MGDVETVTIAEACRRLQVSRATIYRMIADGRLQIVKRSYLHNSWQRVTVASLETLLKQSH